MNILFSGSRTWPWVDKEKILYQLLKLKQEHGDDLLIIHGGHNCKQAIRNNKWVGWKNKPPIESVDAIVDYLCEQHNIATKIYFAQWDLYHKAAGFKRNERMFDDNTIDKVICCYNQPVSKGTEHVKNMAKAFKINLKVIKNYE